MSVAERTESAEERASGAVSTTARRLPRLWLIVAAVIVIFAGSLLIGRYGTPFAFAQPDAESADLAWRLMVNLRLPRIIAALLMGMTLSAAGAVLQMIFRNPLVDAGFLGVSPGAAFGASLGIIVLGGSAVAVQGCAACFAFVGLAAAYFLATRIRYGDWVLRLVLAGIAVSALFSSGTGVFKYMADPLRQLPDITFWMMGGLWAITWPDVLQMLPVVLPCMVVLFLMRWRLNLLSLRDETAFSLGVTPMIERGVILVAAVAATAVVVAKSGIVGWIGLIVPHIARRIVGADAQVSLPGAMLLGGVFALLCDDLARTVLAGEIPLGIITSFLGALLFLTFLMRGGIKVRR